jgi:predicted ABC-type ATPase
MANLYIIAGPNGAGKTTAAATILPETLGVIEFVNADEIAKGISPFNPEGVAFEAGRIMLSRIDQLIKEESDFAFETTLSTLSYLNLVRSVREKDYSVTLIFLWLNSVEIAKQRVTKRVLKGGHNIPEDIIERRFKKGLVNLGRFMEVVDQWYLYDNSAGEYDLIAKRVDGEENIYNFELWEKIKA